MAALVGAAAIGPAPVVLALWIGVFASDVVWLRKLPRAGLINAGREVIALRRRVGPHAAVLALTGRPELSLELLPAATILVCLYFFATRRPVLLHPAVRDKLEHAEKILILRWEIISYLLTLDCVGGGGRRAPAAVAGRVGRRGLALGRARAADPRILEEAIGAEDLNKVHLMETAIASNATLQGSFDQIERLAYRLLDWGDFRIYRVVDGAGPRWPIAGASAGPTAATRPKAAGPFRRGGHRGETACRGEGRALGSARVRVPMTEVGSR